MAPRYNQKLCFCMRFVFDNFCALAAALMAVSAGELVVIDVVVLGINLIRRAIIVVIWVIWLLLIGVLQYAELLAVSPSGLS